GAAKPRTLVAEHALPITMGLQRRLRRISVRFQFREAAVDLLPRVLVDRGAGVKVRLDIRLSSGIGYGSGQQGIIGVETHLDQLRLAHRLDRKALGVPPEHLAFERFLVKCAGRRPEKFLHSGEMLPRPGLESPRLALAGIELGVLNELELCDHALRNLA